MPHYKALPEDPKPVFDREVLAGVFHRAWAKNVLTHHPTSIVPRWESIPGDIRFVREEVKENFRCGIDAVIAYIEETLYD
jgi:hypothetical protein